MLILHNILNRKTAQISAEQKWESILNKYDIEVKKYSLSLYKAYKKHKTLLVSTVRNVPYTVKLALRGHLWGTKWYFKRSSLGNKVVF
jgi:hypothetical protein